MGSEAPPTNKQAPAPGPEVIDPVKKAKKVRRLNRVVFAVFSAICPAQGTIAGIRAVYSMVAMLA